MMCYDIKNVENSKLTVYDGHKRKPWTPESDSALDFGKIYKKFIDKKFLTHRLESQKGIMANKGRF